MRMRPVGVNFQNANILKAFAALPVTMLNLGALFNVVVTGVIVAWYVGMTLVMSLVLALPPYSYTSAAIGYASVGPFLGGLFGFGFMAAVAEPLATWCTRKNHGFYEPEFRLILMAVGMLVTCGGLVGFGFAIQDQLSVYTLATIWGIVLFGITVIVIVCGQYALDAWRNHSTEIFVMNATFKNFFFYGCVPSLRSLDSYLI